MLTPREETIAFRFWQFRQQVPSITFGEAVYALNVSARELAKVLRAKRWHIPHRRKGEKK